MFHDNGKFLKLSGAVLLLAILAFGFAGAERASANILDRFYDFVSPLFKKEAATTTEQENAAQAPLYQPVLDYEKAVVEAVKKASPAVVSITVSKNVPIIEQCAVSPEIAPNLRDFFDELPQFLVPCERGTELKEVGGGSGFIIQEDGLVLTNKHVVSDANASYTVFTNDGKKYDAKVLALDPVQDLAVVKIEAGGLPAIELGDSDSLALGQTVIAIGNALAEYRNTVSVGVVSGLARSITAQGDGFSETLHDLIQTDAAINPGNSGGPLLNLHGEVVGISTAIVSGAQNIGFAIPINRAKRDIRSVKANGEIRTPYLGVRYVIVTPELAKEEKFAKDYGALLKGNEEGPAVMPDSPAARAGLAGGDIIFEINGKRVDRTTPLVGIVSQLEIGEAIALKVQRGDKELSIEVALERRPD